MRFYLTQQIATMAEGPVPVFWAFPIAAPTSYVVANHLTLFAADSVPAHAIVHTFSGVPYSSWPGDRSMFPVPEQDDYDGPGIDDGPIEFNVNFNPSTGVSSEGQGAENPQHDFPQKYVETYVLARIRDADGLGVPQVVYVIAMRPQDNPHKWGDIIWSDGKDKKVTPYIDFEIIRGIPSNKIINTNNNFIAEYSRTPDRQWKRGVCDSTFVAAVPSSWDKDVMTRAVKGTNYTIKSNSERGWAAMGFTMGPFTYPNIKELFNPTYPNYHEAIKRIQDGISYSVAFTERAFVSCSPRTSNLLFGIGTLPVGEIHPNIPDTIIIKEKLLQQELLDVVKRNNLHLKVI